MAPMIETGLGFIMQPAVPTKQRLSGRRARKSQGRQRLRTGAIGASFAQTKTREDSTEASSGPAAAPLFPPRLAAFRRDRPWRSAARFASVCALASLGLFVACAHPSFAGDSSGTAGTASECGSIANAYASSVTEARACEPTKADACSVSRAGSLFDVCRCQIAVSPAAVTRLDDLAAQFRSAGCAPRGVCTRLCKRPDNVCEKTSALCR